MKWSRNPFFKPAAAATAAASPPGDPAVPSDSDVDAEAALARPSSSPLRSSPTPSVSVHGESGHGPTLQRPTTKLTAHQFFYIFILDGLGAAVLSGGINFAIAYAMYTHATTPIRLFQLPNTLAGDAAVTIIIQSLMTWLIELALVNRDLARGGVAPLGFIPQPETKVARWFLFLDRCAEDAEAGSAGHWARFLFSQVVRAMAVAVVGFVLLWGPAVGILTAVGTRNGGDWEFETTWAPQVFKLVLGGLLGLVQTPVFAAFWLVRAGWAMRTNEGR